MSGSYPPDHYDVLQVSIAADSATVRAAFHALIRRWHPDRSEQVGSSDHAARIIEAYRILSHPERRQQYDRRRVQIAMMPGTDQRGRDRRQTVCRCPVDREQMWLWAMSIATAAAVTIGTFLPPLMSTTDLSRDVLRALI